MSVFHVSDIAADLTIRVREHDPSLGTKTPAQPTGEIEVSIPGIGRVVMDLASARRLAYGLTETRGAIIAREKARKAASQRPNDPTTE